MKRAEVRLARAIREALSDDDVNWLLVPLDKIPFVMDNCEDPEVMADAVREQGYEPHHFLNLE
jgi:hypothetical protein